MGSVKRFSELRVFLSPTLLQRVGLVIALNGGHQFGSGQ